MIALHFDALTTLVPVSEEFYGLSDIMRKPYRDYVIRKLNLRGLYVFYEKIPGNQLYWALYFHNSRDEMMFTLKHGDLFYVKN